MTSAKLATGIFIVFSRDFDLRDSIRGLSALSRVQLADLLKWFRKAHPEPGRTKVIISGRVWLMRLKSGRGQVWAFIDSRSACLGHILAMKNTFPRGVQHDGGEEYPLERMPPGSLRHPPSSYGVPSTTVPTARVPDGGLVSNPHA